MKIENKVTKSPALIQCFLMKTLTYLFIYQKYKTNKSWLSLENVYKINDGKPVTNLFTHSLEKGLHINILFFFVTFLVLAHIKRKQKIKLKTLINS